MSAYSMYARSGYRRATGELAPDWDAPRNWNAPYWAERAAAALEHANRLLRNRVDDASANQIWAGFWAAFPDEWMEAQCWRYLAMSAEALRDHLLRLGPDQQPDVAVMIQVYRTQRQV
jgi:hypothetical protein